MTAGTSITFGVKLEGGKASLYVASTPTRVDKKLKQWKKRINELSTQAEKNEAAGRINHIQNLLTAVDGQTREALILQKQKKGDLEKRRKKFKTLDATIESKQGSMSKALKRLFSMYGDRTYEDFRTRFVEELKNLHPKAKGIVQNSVDKIARDNKKKATYNKAKQQKNSKGDGRMMINSWSTLLRLLKDTPDTNVLVNDPIYNKLGYGIHVQSKQITIAAKAALQKKYTKEKERELIKTLEENKQSQAYRALIDQIFDKRKVSDTTEKLRKAFSSNAEHSKYEPVIDSVEDNKPAQGKRTIKYHYKGGNEKFTVVVDMTTGVTDNIVGENLNFKEVLTRGKVKGDTFKGIDRSHLIADEIRGSGYVEGHNLMAASAHYNRKVMRGAEIIIGDRLVKFGSVQNFDIKVKVKWAKPGTLGVDLDDIKDAIETRRKNLQKKKPKDQGSQTKAEIATLLALEALSDSALKTKLLAHMGAIGQPRCMGVEYEVYKIRVDDGTGNIQTLSQTIETKIDEDLLYGTTQPK